MLVLPDHLAPLLRPEPHLDVLGTSDPWVLPADWMATTQQRLAEVVTQLRPEDLPDRTSPSGQGDGTGLYL